MNYRRKAEARLKGLLVSDADVQAQRQKQRRRAERLLVQHYDTLSDRGIELLKHTIRARV